MSANSDFKSRGLSALECLREEFTTKQLAIALYEIYGLKSPIQSYMAHVAACFNAQKPEFFSWCDIVNLCRFTGRIEPIIFMCDELGLSHPAPIDRTAELLQKKARLQALSEEKAQLEAEIARMGSVEMVSGARFMRAV